MSDGLPIAPDAAIVLGIASTAMPFACSSVDAAEHWLRILRLHGQAGAVLQGLGVSEGPLRALEDTEHQRTGPAGADDGDAVARVIERATRLARGRGASGIVTTDILLAVMDVYGAEFERALRAHGTDCDEVIERLGVVRVKSTA